MAEEKRTQFAMAAVDFASVFNTTFSEKPVAGYLIKLTAPEGQSTGGGVQARQHITLSDATGKAIVVGSCNTIERVAELRPFDYVSNQYRQRHAGATFAMTQGAFDQMQQRFSDFFTSQAFQVSQVAPTAPVMPVQHVSAKKSAAPLILGVVVTVLALAVLAYFLFLRQ